MQDLVDATGLNRSSIYNTFGSKLDLYTVCLKSYQTNFKCSIENILKNINSPLKAIEAIFILNIKQNKNNKNIGCLINNCTSEMANQEVTIQKFLDNNHKSMIKLFQDFIEKGQQEGSINKNNTAYEYALYLLNSIQGLSISGILMNNCKQLESIVKTTLSTLK